MDADRRACLFSLIAGLPLSATLIRATVAGEGARRVIEVRIEGRSVVAPRGPIRIAKGEVVELRWMGDEAVELHLHGYDLELRVRPGVPAAMVVEAYATGRFPITSHAWGDGGHGHDVLTYLEVIPN